MAVDLVARGLAAALTGPDGKIAANKMPSMGAISDTSGFYPLGNLKDATLVEGKTAEQILLMMLFGIMTPNFTLPSGEAILQEPSSGVFIAGRQTSLTGTLVFDRGAITPAYGTSGFRAGAATSYVINDLPFDTGSFSFTFTPVLGENVLNWKILYSAGEQPLDSVGAEYDTPFPAGQITGTVSFLAVSKMIDTTGSEKVFDWFEDESGSGYQSVMTSEQGGVKQNFAVSDSMSVVGIKAFDTLSQAWNWIGGSAADSLTFFDTDVVEYEGETYIVYTSNTMASYGERELRIYVTY